MKKKRRRDEDEKKEEEHEEKEDQKEEEELEEREEDEGKEEKNKGSQWLLEGGRQQALNFCRYVQSDERHCGPGRHHVTTSPRRQLGATL